MQAFKIARNIGPKKELHEFVTVTECARLEGYGPVELSFIESLFQQRGKCGPFSRPAGLAIATQPSRA